MMNLRGLGNLAKILEEAAKPDSVLREDREKPKPKVLKKGERVGNTRVMDPKRKVWYEKRLKEITAKSTAPEGSVSGPVSAPMVSASPALAKTVAAQMGGSLLQTLAAAKDAKPKVEGTKRSEGWRRKPGESIF
jgi:predicted nucleic acid-binding Zn ribbon protein